MLTIYKYVTTTLLTITHIIPFAEFIFRGLLKTCAEAYKSAYNCADKLFCL